MYTKFQVTASVSFTDEHGEQKTKPQTYVVDAMSFTEAEARILDVLQSNIIDITAIKGVSFAEIYDSQDKDIFFTVQIAESIIDEVSGKEKKAKLSFLVAAGNLDEAKNLFAQHYQSMTDFDIISIKQTNIIEYIPKEKDSYK